MIAGGVEGSIVIFKIEGCGVEDVLRVLI